MKMQITLILFVLALLISLTACGQRQTLDQETISNYPAIEAPAENDTGNEAAIKDTPASGGIPEPGTLLESGNNLNANYYPNLNYIGSPADLTDSSFVMGTASQVTNAKTAKTYFSTFTVHYGEKTVVKTALLYYGDDRYEIYAGSLDDLKKGVEDTYYDFGIVLENTEADELWASEIIVYKFADL